MFTVKFDDGEVQEFETTIQAEQAIQDHILNSDAESAEILQGDEVVAEYSKDEFDS